MALSKLTAILLYQALHSVTLLLMKTATCICNLIPLTLSCIQLTVKVQPNDALHLCSIVHVHVIEHI